MRTTGRITNVYFERSGSSLIQEYAAGTTSVLVDSSADFNEDGGTCIVGEDVYVYELGETGLESDEIILTPGLLAPTLEGEYIATDPVTDIKMASVAVSDDEGLDGEDMVCVIDHTLTAMLDYGLRDHGLGEFCEVSDESGQLKVISLVGEEGRVLGGALVGPNPDDPTSDGERPADAPVVTVGPFGIRAVVARWARISNRDPVQYRVYASPSSPVDLTPDNYIGTTSGDSFVISKFPTTGTEVSVTAPTFVRVVPFDVDGDGPASIEASGVARAATNGDIAADYAYLGELEATQIRGGNIFTNFAQSDEFATGLVDPRIIMNALGITATDPNGEPRFVLPTDIDLPALFRGVFRADSMTIFDRLSIRGKNNELAKGSDLRLSSATGAPQERPSMAAEYPENAVGDSDPAWVEGGMKKFSDGKWYSYLNAWGSYQIKRRTEDSSGNLGSTEVVISYDSGPSGVTRTVHDILEWNGKLLVLVHDSSVDPAWHSQLLVIRQYEMPSFTHSFDHVVRVALSDRKAAMSATSVSSVVAVGRPDEEDGNRWNVRGWELNITTGPPPLTVYPVYFDHTMNAGRDEDLDSLQYVPTSSLVPGGAGNRWVFKSRGHVCMFAFDNTTRLRTPNDEAPAGPSAVNVLGSVWWDGSRWHVFQQTKIWHLSTFRWSGSYTTTKKVWSRYSWFDSDAGGTGQHESLVGPSQSLNLPKLAFFRVTTAEIPPPDETTPADSVTGVRVWLKYDSATEPAVSAYGRAAVDLADGVISKRYSDPLDVSVSPPNSGTPAPFPGATPSRISSEAGGFIVRGDGTGSWPLLDQYIELVNSMQSLFKIGRIAVTTNASGNATISHTLGRSPVFAASLLTTNGQRAVVSAQTSSTITVHVVNATTGANYAGGITVMWFVA